MIKYLACLNKIKKIEVASETKKTVTLLNGGKEKKQNDWKGYFDSWEKAHEFLIRKKLDEIYVLKARINNLTDQINKLYAMENPSDDIGSA